MLNFHLSCSKEGEIKGCVLEIQRKESPVNMMW